MAEDSDNLSPTGRCAVPIGAPPSALSTRIGLHLPTPDPVESKVDFLDPNFIDFNSPERRIYCDDMAQVFAVVDEEDYHHFIQWRWKPKYSTGNKTYLCRNIYLPGRKGYTVYLHVAIMLRIKPIKKVKRLIVDHKDGESLNCRRSNLRWATYSQNNKNRFGSYALQKRLDLDD